MTWKIFIRPILIIIIGKIYFNTVYIYINPYIYGYIYYVKLLFLWTCTFVAVHTKVSLGLLTLLYYDVDDMFRAIAWYCVVILLRNNCTDIRHAKTIYNIIVTNSPRTNCRDFLYTYNFCLINAHTKWFSSIPHCMRHSSLCF